MNPAKLFNPSAEYASDPLRASAQIPNVPSSSSKPPKSDMSLGGFSVQSSEPQRSNSLNQPPDHFDVNRSHYLHSTPQSALLHPSNISSWPSLLPFMRGYNPSMLLNAGGFPSQHSMEENAARSLASWAAGSSARLSNEKAAHLDPVEDNSSDESLNGAHENLSALGAVKGKRQRSSFTNEQVKALEAVYQQNRYPDRFVREQIALSLNLSDKQVDVWFHNRRAKSKRNNDGFAAELALRTVKKEPKNANFMQEIPDKYTQNHQYTLLKDRGREVITVFARTDLMAVHLMTERLREHSASAPASTSTSEEPFSQGTDRSEGLSATMPFKNLYSAFQDTRSNPSQQGNELSGQHQPDAYTQSPLAKLV